MSHGGLALVVEFCHGDRVSMAARGWMMVTKGGRVAEEGLPHICTHCKNEGE